MLTLVAVVCLATLHTTSAQLQKKDPSACDGASLKLGIGYNLHPTDCTQFVQCYYKKGSIPIPVYRRCEWGSFWDQSQKRCLPAKFVKCIKDKCASGVRFYKHSDPDRCGAYWECIDGKAYERCCPKGQAFQTGRGCVPNPLCKDMCPEDDRVPGCDKKPVSGSPTRYYQYVGYGEWKRLNCPKGRAYNPADCDCSLKGIIVAGRICKPDVSINFQSERNGEPIDVSGNNYKITTQNVILSKGAAYFNGRAKLNIEPLRPSPKDEGVFIIKLRYRERRRRRRRSGNSLQAMVTNGHCGRKESVMIAKMPGHVLVGADCQETSRTYALPTVEKKWKEIIYIHDREKLEARVCGAVKNEWALGPLKDTKCGLQFGSAEGMRGFVGLLDDIAVYRCKPLDAVINLSY